MLLKDSLSKLVGQPVAILTFNKNSDKNKQPSSLVYWGVLSKINNCSLVLKNSRIVWDTGKSCSRKPIRYECLKQNNQMINFDIIELIFQPTWAFSLGK